MALLYDPPTSSYKFLTYTTIRGLTSPDSYTPLAAIVCALSISLSGQRWTNPSATNFFTVISAIWPCRRKLSKELTQSFTLPPTWAALAQSMMETNSFCTNRTTLDRQPATSLHFGRRQTISLCIVGMCIPRNSPKRQDG